MLRVRVLPAVPLKFNMRVWWNGRHKGLFHWHLEKSKYLKRLSIKVGNSLFECGLKRRKSQWKRRAKFAAKTLPNGLMSGLEGTLHKVSVKPVFVCDKCVESIYPLPKSKDMAKTYSRLQQHRWLAYEIISKSSKKIPRWRHCTSSSLVTRTIPPMSTSDISSDMA